MTRQQMNLAGWTHVDQSLPPQDATVRGFYARSITHRVDLGIVKFVGETWCDATTGEPCEEQPNYWKPRVSLPWLKTEVSCE